MRKPIKLLMLVLLVSGFLFACKKDKKLEPESELEKELLTKKPTETPQTLFLIIPGSTSVEMIKNGNVFDTENYIALKAGEKYTYNTKADGTGTTYLIKEALSAYDYANDDKVVWSDPLVEIVQGKGDFSVARSQAYKMTIDFSKAELSWQYYNIKLFYYTDWDKRNEVLLEYKHPYVFEKTLALPADNFMKFYSVNPDWYEWGSETENSMTGTLKLFGGKDIVAVKEAANYKVSITLNKNLQGGTYAFTKQ